MLLSLLILMVSYICATVVQWSEFLGKDPGVQVRFPALRDSLRSSGSGKESSQPRECN
jgi:hypothetical protein